MPLHTDRDGYHRKEQISKQNSSVGEGAGRLEPLCPAGGNVKWCSRSASGTQLHTKLNTEFPPDPATCFCVCPQKHNVVYPQSGTSLSYTRKEPDTCYNMDELEEITPSEISQAQTDRQLAHDSASVRYLEQSHGQGKLDGGCHGQKGRRKDSGCFVGTECHSGRRSSSADEMDGGPATGMYLPDKCHGAIHP